ncbi:hypothetical protein ABMA28_007017 [Loxostege sticticalis]|uniref:RING-type domain-containing protein n=1 Tax=Loxostege sticticalis TaxID=481309 RepID=A0ABD0TP93_LOXSC
MNISNDVIDLTQSFSLAKVHNTTNVVIDLLDTDDSFNSSFITIIERDNITSESAKETPCKKKGHRHKHKLDGLGSSKQDTSKSNKRKSNGWGDCPICWDELGRHPLASTKCGHVYCLKCLEHSLKIEKRCPTCRRVLKGTSAYHPLYINM